MTDFWRPTRRLALLTGAAFAIAPTLSLAQNAPASGPASKTAARVDMKDLMAGEALPDVVVGKADAPVTIVEYASMTCSHCATFALETLPKLKEKYLDAGKAKFILREFPLDPLATAAFMLARCSGDKREALVHLLFSQQRNWAYTDKPLDALEATVRQAGFSSDAFKKCLDDKTLYQNVDKIRQRGGETFGVSSTPTFFINGERRVGAMAIEEFDKLIAAASASATPAQSAPATPAPASTQSAPVPAGEKK